MTGNKVLLDTNVVIELFKGNKEVADLLQKQEHFFIPSAVLAELYLGAYRSSNQEKHLNDIKSFLQQSNVLSVDAITAEHYAFIKTELFKKGTPIPENDIWIAAVAIQHQLPLYTFDKHFNQVANLVLVQ